MSGHIFSFPFASSLHGALLSRPQAPPGTLGAGGAGGSEGRGHPHSREGCPGRHPCRGSSSCVCYTSEDVCCSDETVTHKRLPGICSHPRGVLSPEKGSLSQILRKGNCQFGDLVTYRPPGVPARGRCLPPWEQNLSWLLASDVPSAPRTCQCDEVSPPWLSCYVARWALK